MSKREWESGEIGIHDTYGYRSIYVAHWCDAHGRAGCWHNESGLSDPSDSPRRPLVVIDPENREQVTRLADLFERTLCARPVVDRMRDSLRAFANPTPPKPEVYTHVVGERSHGVTQALCGKVWMPGAGVTVVGKCPECKSLAEEWTA